MVQLFGNDSMPDINDILLPGGVENLMSNTFVEYKEFFSFLYPRILCVIESGGLCKVLQKYLTFRISSRHARRSTPQKSRIKAGAYSVDSQ